MSTPNNASAINPSRYPYTYAADYLRAYSDCDSHGVRLSRSESSQIRQAVARAISMNDAELARKLADHYLANQSAIDEQSTRRLIAAIT